MPIAAAEVAPPRRRDCEEYFPLNPRAFTHNMFHVVTLELGVFGDQSTWFKLRNMLDISGLKECI